MEVRDNKVILLPLKTIHRHKIESYDLSNDEINNIKNIASKLKDKIRHARIDLFCLACISKPDCLEDNCHKVGLKYLSDNDVRICIRYYYVVRNYYGHNDYFHGEQGISTTKRQSKYSEEKS